MDSSVTRETTGLPDGLAKARTGIVGLDQITAGGLPRGRTTLICGGPGCGKTLLGVEFLVRGAQEFAEPGVLVCFEESAAAVTANVTSMGFDLAGLQERGLLDIDEIRLNPAETAEIGDYDLTGLFARLSYAIERIGAKRVVLDTVEVLFGMFANERILRTEIRRLFRWLSDQGLTAVVTAERGDGVLTRFGLEEYVSDCVLLLDQQIERRSTTRRLRVVKYRGSAHGGDEYPFIITARGLSVLPITSIGLTHDSNDLRISTGLPRLDAMLGGQGVFAGSSVLISGSAGAGKSSLAAVFAEATCRRGERALYLAYEQSPQEIVRNMRSIGVDLESWIAKGLLALHAERPTAFGFETHLARVHALVEEVRPDVVVVDPISAFAGPEDEITSLLARLVDFLKDRGVTALLTSLARDTDQMELSGLGISSVIDTWITLRAVVENGERNRLLELIKSRGMAHSNQVREFLMSDAGLDLQDVYTGLEGIAVGSARVAREGERRLRQLEAEQKLERQHRALTQRRAVIEAQVAMLNAELEFETGEVAQTSSALTAQADDLEASRAAIGRSRAADPMSPLVRSAVAPAVNGR